MTKTQPDTQGARIASHLRRGPHTYMEMLALGISTCPQKRVQEYLAIHPELELHKGERKANGGDVLVTWAIRKSA